MAITAIQRIPDGEDVWGRMRVRVVDVVLGAYVNPGGFVINASDLGMKMIYSVDLAGQNTASLAWTYFFDINASVGSSSATGVPEASFAIKAFIITSGIQVANAVDLSTATIRLCIIGR